MGWLKPVLVGGGILGIGGLVALAFKAEASPGPRGAVDATLKMRRGTRIKWRGKLWGTTIGTSDPKFTTGDRVIIHDPVAPDPLTEGKAATIVELVLNELVDAAPGSVVPVAGAPLRWTYVLDLRVGEPPTAVEVAEEALARAVRTAPVAVLPPAPKISEATLARQTAPTPTIPEPVPAPAPTPIRPLPLYPAGMTAQLGQYKGDVKRAWFDLGRWNYQIDVSPIPFIGTYQWSGSEDEAKAEIAKRTGQQPGAAYAQGATFMRNGKGGQVERVQHDASGYSYSLKGWGSPISETEFAKVLGAA